MSDARHSVEFIVRTTSGASTQRVAAALAPLLQPPVCLRLVGPLGAGKTTFVRGLVHALGDRSIRVQSPTFALAHSYATTPVVHHLDLYRLEGDDAAYDLGLADQLLDPEAIACVEWPDQAPGIFERLRTITVQFPENASPSRRLRIRLRAEDPLATAEVESRLSAAARHK